jgi:hypothetical protein
MSTYALCGCVFALMLMGSGIAATIGMVNEGQMTGKRSPNGAALTCGVA